MDERHYPTRVAGAATAGRSNVLGAGPRRPEPARDPPPPLPPQNGTACDYQFGYTGVYFSAASAFLVIVQVGTVTNPSGAAEQRYDWGAPLLPVNSLSTLVVVPMAKGCAAVGGATSAPGDCDNGGLTVTGNAGSPVSGDNAYAGTSTTSASCVYADGSTNSRSPIWVSPVEGSCFVKVTPPNNPGSQSNTIAAYGCDAWDAATTTCTVSNAYASVRFTAGVAPWDISGAVVQAYKCDPVSSTCDETTGTPVKIAVMWGQDPAWSGTLAARIFL